MSGKKGTPSTPYDNAEFIRCELNEEQKQDLRKMKKDGWDGWDTLSGLADEGYRISIKYDTYSSSISCFIQQMREDGDNSGLILTGRGRSAQGAVMEALYKHSVIFDGVWPVASFKGKPVMWDD